MGGRDAVVKVDSCAGDTFLRRFRGGACLMQGAGGGGTRRFLSARAHHNSHVRADLSPHLGRVCIKRRSTSCWSFFDWRCSLDTRAIDYHEGEHKNCTLPPTCAYPLTKTNCPEVMNYALAHNGGRRSFCAVSLYFLRRARTSSEGIKMQTNFPLG